MRVDSAADLAARVAAVRARGVIVVDERQCYVAPDVVLDRLCAGAVLHPGARLSGARTYLAPGAEVGPEGPATLRNVVLGTRARIDSGYAEDAVLLRDARAGANAHLREGTLLEEQASTAHAVGLKQTILGCFVTLGSLINFCDVLMMGGTSREDHSEVGSGYIHFNFTPWGKRGDKATASLVGDVARGALLREPRIFLGGSGGMVGPRSVGYGAIAAAGQVLRNDVGAGRLVAQAPRSFDAPFDPGRLDRAEPRAHKNLRYIGELVALRAWYRQVRRPRVPAGPAHDPARVPVDEALRLIDGAIAERRKRLEAFLRERGVAMPALPLDAPDAPMPVRIAATEPYEEHVAWVQALPEPDADALVGWLRGLSDRVVAAGALADR